MKSKNGCEAGIYHIHSNNRDYIMVDSGAEVNVCPLDYANEIPLIEVDEILLPTLHTVTGKPIKIIGIRLIEYQIADGHWVLVKYYVCDVDCPILGTGSLNRGDYDILLSKATGSLLQYHKFVCPLYKDKDGRGSHSKKWLLED